MGGWVGGWMTYLLLFRGYPCVSAGVSFLLLLYLLYLLYLLLLLLCWEEEGLLSVPL